MKNRTLFDFQSEGVAFLRAAKQRLLRDDPGLGKTTQAIAALPEVGCRCVIVCPAAVKAVWRDELSLLRPDLTIKVLYGRGSFTWPKAGEAVILNPDILPGELGQVPNGVSLIADEAHLFKSPTAIRSQRFRHMALKVLPNGGTVWALTGTPLFNWPPDLYGVFHALDLHNKVFGSYQRFVWLFRGYPTRWGLRWGSPRGEVSELVRLHSLGRTREQVLPQLPTKTYRSIEVSTGRVKDAERISDQDLMKDMDKERTSPALSQARAALALAKGRSSATHELLSLWEAEGPVIVFSAHVEAIKAIGEREGWGHMTGSTNSSDRDYNVLAFQQGKLKGLAGTIGAMGVGVTLTAGHRVVFLDRAWTPAENKQAEDRVCRIGQTRGVEVIDLISADSPLDSRVFKLLRTKTRITEAVFDTK